jgi:hypothetical protein
MFAFFRVSHIHPLFLPTSLKNEEYLEKEEIEI